MALCISGMATIVREKKKYCSLVRLLRSCVSEKAVWKGKADQIRKKILVVYCSVLVQNKTEKHQTNQPFFRASRRKTRFSAKLPCKHKSDFLKATEEQSIKFPESSNTLTKTLSPTTFSSWSWRVISLRAIRSSVCSRPAQDALWLMKLRLNQQPPFKHTQKCHSPLRCTCRTVFFTSGNSSSSLRAQRRS